MAAEQAALTRESLPTDRRGIMLASMFTDAVTQQETWTDMINGKKISPIMFPQSVPSAIIGFLAKELNIHGPMTCLGGSRNGVKLALQQAADWLIDGDADAVAVTFCDVPSWRAQAWVEQFGGREGASFGGGVVTAVLEPAALAAGRGCEPLMTLEAFAAWMDGGAADGRDKPAYHGMASGLR
uniref:Beta-ketoacyl synthase-like N-terminal domain-containing protein n=2 Tax=Paenibacillus athensensis TaxID=1967502 RepID=A0A4Y8Q6T2_9BACL